MHTFDVVLAFLVGVFVVLKFVGEYERKIENGSKDFCLEVKLCHRLPIL